MIAGTLRINQKEKLKQIIVSFFRNNGVLLYIYTYIKTLDSKPGLAHAQFGSFVSNEKYIVRTFSTYNRQTQDFTADIYK